MGGVAGNIWINTRIGIYDCLCIAFGTSMGLLPLCSTFAEFSAVLVCAGLLFGNILGLYVVVLIDLIGTHNLGDGLGYNMLSNGLGAFLGPVIAGKLFWS